MSQRTQTKNPDKSPGRENLAERTWPGPDTPWAHRRPEYPLASCVPAEPASVSSGDNIGTESSVTVQPLDIGVMPQKIQPSTTRPRHARRLITNRITGGGE